MYHTGIKRDDNQVWRKVSDGVEVNLGSWIPGDPFYADAWDFMYWKHDNDVLKNLIHNYFDGTAYFICQYKHLV